MTQIKDVFYVRIIIYLKLQLLLATFASCPVRDLSSPRVDQSARCSVRELAIRELAYPRVVQLPYCSLVQWLKSLHSVEIKMDDNVPSLLCQVR